jgi:hypothetical protein
MRRLWVAAASLFLIAWLGGALPAADEKTPAQRGWEALSQKHLNPGLWSSAAYGNVWKQWGLKEKPADYDRLVRERYGLQPAPFDNHGLPLGLQRAPTLFGQGMVNSCLLCHAGTVAGQTIIGLGNSALDLQSLFEDLTRVDGLDFRLPHRFSYVRGTIDPISPVIFLLSMRDGDLNLRQPEPRQYPADLCSDPPAWWLIKRKKTRDWTGNIDARSTRVDMVNLLSPFNSPETIKQKEATFADISAFLLTVPAPKYPFPIDEARAVRGKEVYLQTCKKCHGLKEDYPNKIIPLEQIGTDPLLCASQTPELGERLNRTWLAREMGPEGKPLQITESTGYQAPPLDGIWATAPYFHNASVPTIYHVLNSRARPRFFTRTYRSGKEDYDTDRLGHKVTVLDGPADPKLPDFERRKVYDTTRPGQANTGHTYGDKLTEEERQALIEFLKTLQLRLEG